MSKNIYVTQADYQSLRTLINSGKYNTTLDGKYLGALEAELLRATIVTETEIPSDVVTMNSVVCVENLGTGAQSTYQLVFPDKADFETGKISILAPIGTALIGERKGNVIKWQVPSGNVKLKIVKIEYQPEAAKDYNQTFNISGRD